MMERAVLVTIEFDRRDGLSWSLEDEARELHELAQSAGCRIVGTVGTKRHKPVAGTFIGEGKLAQIAELVDESQAQVVVFNQELSPAQQRNIEEALSVKTIDRTQLILDIFAQRAKSQEGKVQVELAQLRYLMPRLVGKGIWLSRLGGGIGTRGPGEQKLEVDRRRIRQRITRLNDGLEKLKFRRAATRQRRKETATPTVALVGYTNAGKTTLLNRLTKTVSVVDDRMFTTLDPLARRLRLPDGETVVLTDTVGFLHRLPHQLIEAFKATLEEAQDADLLLHVLDVSHPLAADQGRAVQEVLADLGLKAKPTITVLNKLDQIEEPSRLAWLEHEFHPAVAISARHGEGIDRLLGSIIEQLELSLMAPIRLVLPTDRSDLLALVYRHGQVMERIEHDSTTELTARLPAKFRQSLHAYILA